MLGTHQTIGASLFTRLTCGVLLVAALVMPAGAAGAGRQSSIKGAWREYLPQGVHGTSVAIAPDGVPWFGLSLLETEPSLSLAHVGAGKAYIEGLGAQPVPGKATAALQFDSRGSLWVAIDESKAIARRDPDGTVTEFPLPPGAAVTALTIGPEGDIWFVRGGYGKDAEAAVGRMSTAGVVTQFPLAPGSRPASVTVGPDGAIWFSEEQGGQVGRVTASDLVQLFPLPAKAQPRQIVAGPDGALWFGENARARRYGKFSSRIGRITVDGQESEMSVPFGEGTSRLAADPRGVVWFATDEGEISSISPSGNVGARGCSGECGIGVEGLALAPDGALWFAGAVPYCANCGGGSNLILRGEGNRVGEIPAGALRPADPFGPPAKDPYAHLPANAPPPLARTAEPDYVNATEAGLAGYINPRGYPATWRFRWGESKAYGHLTYLPEGPRRSGRGNLEVGNEIFGLCPQTTYHYELVAYGPGGRTLGGDRTFRTTRVKRPPKHCRAH